jgi:mono/diheme cytochrome c family protein
MDYPIWDVSIGPSMMIAIVAIAHVIVSHFAVGGGLLIAVTETLAVKRSDEHLRELARRSSLVLILLSTVFGAISGVGIWVTVGLAAPAAISSLIHNYVWGWAIEWVFFIVEIVAALVYYNTWGKVKKGTHVMIAWVYFVAAYMSLVIINGIITFMLTPGKWLETRAFWDGFFNPTYWPALVLRTGIVLMMAVVFMTFAALRAEPEARPRLMRFLGGWLAAGALVAYAGYRWWEGVLPEGIRGLFLGADPTLATLATTRHFTLWALTATLVVGVLLLLAFPRAARWPTLVVLLIAAASFFGGYERLREGVRKPYIIHDYMFSNGLRVDQLAQVRENGALSSAVWAAHPSSEEPEVRGRQIFRAQCAICHTLDGYQSIRALVPEDSDMTFSVLYTLYDMGEAFTTLEPGATVDKSKLDYPFMPPFAGTEEEMEDLTAYLSTLVANGGGQ